MSNTYFLSRITARPLKAIIFDLDDTIISLSESADRCWWQTCQYFFDEQYPNAQDFYDALHHARKWYWQSPERHQIGRMNLHEARITIVSQALSHFSIESPELATKIAHYYAIERDKAICLFPDATATLAQLRQQNYQLALITNGASSGQWQKIQRFNLEPYFACITVEGDLGIGKPDERIYHHTLQQLVIQPEETCMVGDNLSWDVNGPQAVGIKGIWVDNAQTGLPANSKITPAHIIHSISDLVFTS